MSHPSGTPGSEVATLDRATVAQFAEMATLIPAETDSAEAVSRILAQVLSAATWDELDDPWEVSKVEQLAGQVLRLDYAQRRPSDFRDGLGMFLVLHCVNVRTGEVVVVTTSSVAVIGQIVRAYALGALPLYIEFVIAERPTQSGYRPHHLKIHGSGAGEATADDNGQTTEM